MSSTAANPPVRIAYILLAHKMMEQLARLIRAIDDGNATFFVHLDRRSGEGLWQELKRHLPEVDIRPIPRRACYWGSHALVLATLDGIRAVLDSAVGFDRVQLLSGQDYPIKSAAHRQRFLAQHPDDEFIEAFSFLSHNRWSQWPGAGRDRSRAYHWHLRIRSRWLHLPLRRRFPLGMTPYGGSQWWNLTRSCIEYIDEFLQQHPGFTRYYRHAFIPDEQFFQTIVANSPFAERITGHDLTYVDGDPPTPPRPATLNESYLPLLLKSAKLFARKFDRHYDEHILDRLDVLNAGAAQPRAGADERPAAFSMLRDER